MGPVIYLASGATEDDIYAALQGMTEGGTLVLPKDEVIPVRFGIDVNVTNRSITIDLNGSTLRQAGDVTVVSGGGSMGAVRAVSLDVSGANAAITYGSLPPGIAVGDWIKVASDDPLPNDNRNTEDPTRLGQAMKVIGIQGNTVVLEGRPLNAELYQTNVRAAEVVSGTLTLLNGTVQGDQSQGTWLKDLVNIRSAVDAYVERLTVRDGNSMGINIVNGVNVRVVDSVVMNLKDDTTNGNFGYGVHSAGSLGTTVIGLYGERTRHVTDNNGVGIPPNQSDLSKYGADIGMVVRDAVAYYNTAFSYSWHSEGRLGLLDNVMSFESHGFVGLRGVGNTILNSASVGDERGFQFYEYGYGDSRDMVVDNVVMREAGLYVYVVSGNPTNNVIRNSYLEYDYRPGNPGTTRLENTTVVMTDGDDADRMQGTAAADRLLGGRGGDLLLGEGGGDLLWGGAGVDTLTGGAGTDRFAYHDAAEGGDVITDFQAGAGGDVLDVSVIAARHGWRGDPVAAGHLRFVQSGSDTLVQVDQDGGGDGFATLATLKGVSAGAITADNLQLLISGGAGTYAPPPPPTAVVPPGSNPAVRGVSITGTAGADRIDGTTSPGPLPGAGPDTIQGGDGDDTIDGLGGADVIIAGAGNDTVVYRPGATSINGGSGRDVLVLTGTDIIDLSNAADQSLGKTLVQGFDDVDARISPTAVFIIGNASNNVLWGSAFDDRIKGGAGNDRIDAGDGIDTIIYDGNREDYAFIKVSADTWRVQDLRPVGPDGRAPDGRDYLTNIERVSLADALLFEEDLNRAPTGILLSAADAPESLAVGEVVGIFSIVDPDAGEIDSYELLDDAGGRFTVVEATKLVLAKPLDREAAGSHAITVRVTDSVGHTFDQSFTITVGDVNEAPTGIALSKASVAENVAAGTVVGALTSLDPDAGDAGVFALLDDAGGRFALQGSTLVTAGPLDYETAASHQVRVQVTDAGGLTREELFTIAVTDVNEAPTAGVTINGTAGDDTISGSAGPAGQPRPTLGADRIAGNDGNDVIDGLGGFDTLVGGNGDDTIRYRPDAAQINGGAGRDTLVTTSGDAINLSLADQSAGAPVVTGMDDVDGSGATVALILTGNASNNALRGGSGADTLDGGAGSDVLAGGAGADRLTGGLGRDFFLFDTAPGGGNVDTITDFVVVDDTVRLDDAAFAGVGPVGVLASAAFAVGTAAATSAHRVLYDAATGDLRYDADGAGGAQAVLFARMGAGLGVTAQDFVIV